MSDLLYVIVQHGVYRHCIGGVFDTKEKAILAAVEMVKGEKDRYHDVLVLEYSRNKNVEDGDLVCTVGGYRKKDDEIDITYPDTVNV